MHIVLEGPDNAGKSTLSNLINNRLPRPRRIILSKGPEKYPGEINDRVDEYLSIRDPVIFDRHPAISQNIYRMIHQQTAVTSDRVAAVYAQCPVLIYCRPPTIDRGMDGHVEKPDGESEEFLAQVDAAYPFLVLEYDKWAMSHAHMIYRIGDDMERIYRMIHGVME